MQAWMIYYCLISSMVNAACFLLNSRTLRRRIRYGQGRRVRMVIMGCMLGQSFAVAGWITAFTQQSVLVFTITNFVFALWILLFLGGCGLSWLFQRGQERRHLTERETFEERAAYHRRGELKPGEHALAQAIRESLEERE